VWYKPTATPDPVKDRCALAHEYIFHFVKQRRYYFDATAVAIPSKGKRPTKTPPTVWTIPNTPSRKIHQAVFPEQLVSLPLRATCPTGGVLLDPFCGSATGLIAALIQDREIKVIGIDISEEALKEANGLLLTYSKQLLHSNHI
jgi:site-specific DNA-methyltransferase (adenine-specific)